MKTIIVIFAGTVLLLCIAVGTVVWMFSRAPGHEVGGGGQEDTD